MYMYVLSIFDDKNNFFFQNGIGNKKVKIQKYTTSLLIHVLIKMCNLLLRIILTSFALLVVGCCCTNSSTSESLWNTAVPNKGLLTLLPADFFRPINKASIDSSKDPWFCYHQQSNMSTWWIHWIKIMFNDHKIRLVSILFLNLMKLMGLTECNVSVPEICRCKVWNNLLKCIIIVIKWPKDPAGIQHLWTSRAIHTIQFISLWCFKLHGRKSVGMYSKNKTSHRY